jgi:hypothetical protein
LLEIENIKKDINRVNNSTNNFNLIQQLNVRDNVVFHGKQFGDSLDGIFENCLLGVGTLALNLRKADTDTAIKNIEYLSRNIPVITSGFIFNINAESGLYKILNEEVIIDFNELYDFTKEFYEKSKHLQVNDFIKPFLWKNIMLSIMETIE